ncbi:hypothetical protein AB0P45_10240 [Streptomyces niveus]|uniref:hypothetical protein n=1 Tax=Streptomyces niveus TaxID=193462 RepID=UPI0034289E3D
MSAEMTAVRVPQGAARAPGRSVFEGESLSHLTGLALTASAGRPVFADDRWFLDVTGAPRSTRRTQKTFDFSLITNPRWRPVAKEMVVALMAPGHQAVASLPHAFRSPFKVVSANHLHQHLVSWLNFLTARGVRALGEVTQDDCDAYRLDRSTRRRGQGTVSATAMTRRLAPVLYVAFYGELFSTDAYPPGFLPWNGRPLKDVAQDDDAPAGSITPPVPETVFQPLLAAALYVTRTLGPLVEKEWATVCRTAAESPSLTAQRRGNLGPQALAAMTGEIDRYVRTGTPLPRLAEHHIRTRRSRGWSEHDPVLEVNLAPPWPVRR